MHLSSQKGLVMACKDSDQELLAFALPFFAGCIQPHGDGHTLIDAKGLTCLQHPN